MLRHLGRDANIVAAVAIVVEERFTEENAIFPGGDHGTRLLLRRIKNLLDRRLDRRCAELREQLCRTPFSEVCGADHGRKIAAKVTWIANVERDHVEQIVTQLARLVEFYRRDAQTFLPDFGGV